MVRNRPGCSRRVASAPRRAVESGRGLGRCRAVCLAAVLTEHRAAPAALDTGHGGVGLPGMPGPWLWCAVGSLSGSVMGPYMLFTTAQDACV